MITQLDRTLHDLLTAACMGTTNAIELTEQNRVWELTTAPLVVDNHISGVVIRINSLNSGQPSIIRSDPEILDSVPFRAGVVDVHGIFLAANKFLSLGISTNLTGKNIADIAITENKADLLHIIMKKSGSVECRIPELARHENFYPFIYYDEELNEKPKDEETEQRRMMIHASPIKWNDTEAVMLTFEDITEVARTHDQLRRILTFDAPTGILNRRGMEHIIRNEFFPAVRTSGHLSLIALCLDKFRAVNDAKGWEAGNRILRDFAYTVRKFLAGHARTVTGRWSGDEFMILAHCSGAAAVVLANEIRERAKDIAISAGVADLTEGVYGGVSEFIGAAYDAMMQAKREGGDITILAGKK